MAQDSIKAIQLTGVDSSTVAGAYASINPGGFSHSLLFMRIVNDSDKSVTISYDGVIDHEYVAANSSFNFPSQSVSQPANSKAFLKKGTVVYVKGSAGTGSITLSGYYL